jgi:transposase-like protein
MLKNDGRAPFGAQRFRCPACRRTRTNRSGTPFAGHRWPAEVITTAVRWYFRYRLSLAERGIDVSARTVLIWAHRFGPLLAAAARRAARPVGQRWWVDETYIRVRGRWAYLYRAVDEHGQVVDVLLRERRDLASARASFDQAIARRGARPKVVITDKRTMPRGAPSGMKMPGRVR